MNSGQQIGVFVFLHCLCVLCIQVCCKRVSMKIVEEPSSFGFNNHNQDQVQAQTIAMRVQPSNFSGPPHLRALYEKCFTKLDDSYKYEFCPFANVTQHEQSLRWNPYSGVLGVWQEWEIENNTFTAMLMREGDACGQVYRTMSVVLKCGEENEIDKVTEPSTCNYLMIFKTPYVCHRHSMLVYPTLSAEWRHEWDVLEGQLADELLTPQGYNKRVHRIFEAAGLTLPSHVKDQMSQHAKEKEQQQALVEKGEFDTLETCSAEYKKLKDEISGLRTLLAVYQGHNNTNGANKRHRFDDYGHQSDYNDPYDEKF